MSTDNFCWTDSDMREFAAFYSLLSKDETEFNLFRHFEKFKEQKQASKTPVKEFLFVTTDNVAIYEGDKYWFVDKLIPHCNTALKSNGAGMAPLIYKYFSTEEAAKSYCELNKPCLSLLEVHEAIFTQYGFNADKKAYEKLKELAKQKQSL